MVDASLKLIFKYPWSWPLNSVNTGAGSRGRAPGAMPPPGPPAPPPAELWGRGPSFRYIIAKLPLKHAWNTRDFNITQFFPAYAEFWGLVSLGGTGRDDISMQFASRDFRPCVVFIHGWLSSCLWRALEFCPPPHLSEKSCTRPWVNRSQLYKDDQEPCTTEAGLGNLTTLVFFSTTLLGNDRIFTLFFTKLVEGTRGVVKFWIIKKLLYTILSSVGITSKRLFKIRNFLMKNIRKKWSSSPFA